jgi:heme O synthase-like polyprenyltransferase
MWYDADIDALMSRTAGGRSRAAASRPAKRWRSE